MKYCSECANPLSLQIPTDDTRLRHVCGQCGVIHYQNPKLVVGSIPLWDDGKRAQVLLCRRAIEPRHGFWTLPAGFMENSETTAEAALRETIEEAGAHIELQPLFSLLNVAHVDQVHLYYRARLKDLDFAPGVESLEVKLFSQDEIPWDQIAFTTVSHTLKFFFADLAAVRTGKSFGFHSLDITRPESKTT